MQTTQNNISIRFLLLGLVSISSLNCAKNEWTMHGDFNIVNSTTLTITIADPNKTYRILPGTRLNISQEQPSKREVRAEDYENPITQEVGPRSSLIIKIGDKCLTATKESQNSILNITNYKNEKLGKRAYRFTYTFTSSDYDRSIECR